MQYTIYIDVLFLVNFFMDFWILWLMRLLLKYSATYLKLMLSAAVGAAWVCFLAVTSFLPAGLKMIISYAGISSLMIFLAFGKKKPKELLTGVIYLYVFAFSLGGILNFLYFHTKIGSLPRLFLMAAIGVGYTCLLFFEVLRKKKRACDLYDVDLIYRERKTTVKGLLDSGNGLFDPVSKKPVNVVEYGACKDLIISVEKVRYIPFQSVGKTDGLLVGIEIDECMIHMGDKIVTIQKPMIGICKHSLCADHRYQMLLHPSLTEQELP